MRHRLIPVFEDGLRVIVLFDIYVDGQWHGSRRTYRQCEHYLGQLK